MFFKHPIIIVTGVVIGIALIMAFVHIKASSYSKKRVIEDCHILIEADFKQKDIPLIPENTDPTRPENADLVIEICGQWRLNTIQE